MPDPYVPHQADLNDVLHEQLDELMQHEANGRQCAAVKGERCWTCERRREVFEDLLEPFHEASTATRLRKPKT